MSNILSKTINKKLSRRTFLKTSAAATALAALGDKLLGGPVKTLVEGVAGAAVEDKWVPSGCNLCRKGRDLIRGHVVNGVLVNIEGNPEHKGKLPSPSLACIKPRGLPQWVYNPYRLKAPMKRTNPKKGINEDPGFVEISWDEALDTVASKLKEVGARGLKNEYGWNRVVQSGMGPGAKTVFAWSPFFSVFGPTDSNGTWQQNCYNSQHSFSTNWHHNYACTPDLVYGKWFMSLGKSGIAATGAGYAVHYYKRISDFVERGGKDVWVAPFQGVTGAKADEWIPIKPSTDAAFLYAMVNVILHEMNWRQECDLEHLKKMSNSPYLVTPNGYWARDPVSKKPLVWDSVNNVAKVEDDPTIGDFALDGGPYTIDAVESNTIVSPSGGINPGVTSPVTQGMPSFQLLIDHFRDYTPEWASAITDIPAETIRRIAHEFVENSMVGKTIELEGETFPLRGASLVLGKTVTSGVGTEQTAWAEGLLYTLMGSMHVPGGMVTPGQEFNTPTINWTKAQRRDGFPPIPANQYGSISLVWPPTARAITILKGSPAVVGATIRAGVAVHELPGSIPDLYVTWANNMVSSHFDANQARRGLEKVPFFANFAYTFNETNWFADLIMPDTLYSVEEWGIMSTTDAGQGFIGHDYAYAAIRQPMIESPVNARDLNEIMTDLAIRMGPAFHTAYNKHSGIMGPTAEGSPRKYSVEEIMDYQLKNLSSIPPAYRGPGLDYFKEHSALFWPLTKLQHYNIYRVYKRTGTRYDLPYQEGFKRSAEKRLEDYHNLGIYWLDPQLEWFTHGLLPYVDSRAINEEVFEAGPRFPGSEYDLWARQHRVHQYGFGRNKDMPWMIEFTDPLSRGIVMHPDAAAARGLKDGDWVAVESKNGRTTGRLIVSPCIHPDSIEMPDVGHYQTPIAREQGIPSQTELKCVDTRLIAATSHIGDGSIVKVYKTEEIIPNKPEQR